MSEARAAGPAAEPPPDVPLVHYHSRGRVLLIGPWAAVRDAARRLDPRMAGAALVGDLPGEPPPAEEPLPLLRGTPETIDGHLGAFAVQARTDAGVRDVAGALGLAHPRFDLILDLGREPALARAIPPPGYLHAGGADPGAAIETLRELVGEFAKPRYFAYDEDLCAHGPPGVDGCNRCLAACAAEAIRSEAGRVAVDPYLCQGSGACASVCPTGAMTWQAADPGALLAAARERLGDAHGARLVLGDASTTPADGEGARWLTVDQLTAVGAEVWLGALASGAAEVVIATPPDLPPSSAAALDGELAVARALLEALGHDPARLGRVDRTKLAGVLAVAPRPPAVETPARYAPLAEKRTLMHLALAHLRAHGTARGEPAPLPAGAPFGAVRIDEAGCTLCMACAEVCPTSAITAGDEHPAVRFTEERCVQCGACSSACPEEVVTLVPRLADERTRRERRTLVEDAPLHCLGCGKPFATQRMIDHIRRKLEGHWMFQEARARRRLALCETCRVQDLRDAGELPDGGGGG